MNRSRTLILAAILALPLAACGAGAASDAPSDEPTASLGAPSEAAAPSEGAGGVTVTIADFAFAEAEVTIGAGETVTFVNEDSAAHTVTEGTDGAEADGSRFNEEVAGSEEVEVTFDEAGTYEVTCLFHPTMNMTVVVEG